ncbi:MAG: hypothetical protein KF779_09990 [Hyphomonadaceae bacterium]|nr:hypothetical protein [Hyphomonadaceae bacterium]
MSRMQTTRLRESHAPLPRRTKIVDAEYQVIARPTAWRRVLAALTAIFWAAAIGFAVPQIWNAAVQIGAFFAEG